MDTISDLFSRDPLRTFTKQTEKVEVLEKFNGILDPSSTDRTIGTLVIFVRRQPFRYWNRAQVIDFLNLLESNVDRNIKAISIRSSAIDRGLAAIYRQPPNVGHEDTLNLNEPRDLIELSTYFMPEYLRWAEHIFSNLLEYYWCIVKKRAIEGTFVMKGALARIKSIGLHSMVNGYDDDVRNGIAHGDFSISPFEIQFWN